jgi:methyl-accepting chemotaxis protein
MRKNKNKRKWRNFLIRNDIQLRLAMHNLIFIVFVIGVVTVTALAPLYVGFQNSDNLWSQYFSATFFVVIIERLSIASIGILIFGLLYHIIITHRLCGSLVNFGQTFHRIAQGDLSRKIHLRRKDFLKREANQVNHMIDVLSINISELKQYNDLMQKKIDDFAATKYGFTQPDQFFSEIKEMIDDSRNILSQFKSTEALNPSKKDQLAN